MVVQFLFQAAQQHRVIAMNPLFALVGRDRGRKERWGSVDEIPAASCLSGIGYDHDLFW